MAHLTVDPPTPKPTTSGDSYDLATCILRADSNTICARRHVTTEPETWSHAAGERVVPSRWRETALHAMTAAVGRHGVNLEPNSLADIESPMASWMIFHQGHGSLMTAVRP